MLRFIILLLTIDLVESWEARLGGDLRLRREWDFQSQGSNGLQRNDRIRTRLRLRPEVKVKVSDQTGFVFRLRTGDLEAIQSSNYTLIQNVGSKGNNSFPNYDRWVLTKQFGKTRWSIGRNQINYWRQNEYLWDKDVVVDGIERTQYLGNGESLNLGLFKVPRGAEPIGFSERSDLAFLQYLKSRTKKSWGSSRWALGYLALRDGSDQSNNQSTLNNLDYDIIHLAFQRQFALRNRLKLGLDVLRNLQTYPSTLPLSDSKLGYSVQVYFGKLGKKGDLKYGVRYASIDNLAVNPFTANDNWTRWSLGKYIQGSNYTGIQTSISHQMSLNEVITLKYICAHEKEVLQGRSEQSSHRIRLDYVVEF